MSDSHPLCAEVGWVHRTCAIHIVADYHQAHTLIFSIAPGLCRQARLTKQMLANRIADRDIGFPQSLPLGRAALPRTHP